MPGVGEGVGVAAEALRPSVVSVETTKPAEGLAGKLEEAATVDTHKAIGELAGFSATSILTFEQPVATSVLGATPLKVEPVVSTAGVVGKAGEQPVSVKQVEVITQVGSKEAAATPGIESGRPSPKAEVGDKVQEQEGQGTETTGAENKPEEETIDQKIDKAGDKVVDAAVNGKGSMEEALAEFVKLQMEKEGLGNLTSEDLLKRALTDFLNPNESRFPKAARRELEVQRRVRQKLIEMMQLEAQMMVAPRQLEIIKKQAEETKNQLRAIESKIGGSLDDPNVRVNRMQFYALLERLANLKAVAIRTKHSRELLGHKLRDLRREVKGMLGMYKGIGGLLTRFADWSTTRVGEEATFRMMDVESAYDFP